MQMGWPWRDYAALAASLTRERTDTESDSQDCEEAKIASSLGATHEAPSFASKS